MSSLTVDQTTVPYRSEFVQILSAGDGPTLGYLHGFIGNPGPPPFLTALADTAGHRVVAPTLPGFTGSPAQPRLRSIHDWVVATSEIVDAVGVNGRTLVASSIGAMLALELAAVRPDAFSALVLIAPMGLWSSERPVADPIGETLSGQRALLTADTAVTGCFFDDQSDEPEHIVSERVDRYISRTTSASLVWPIPDHGLSDRLHRVTCPVTLLWGSDDAFVPVSYLDDFARALPNVAAAHVVAGAGHLAEWDDPQAVANIVAATLGG